MQRKHDRDKEERKEERDKFRRTNQLDRDDDEGLATPQAPTRDAETPSKEQLLRGVLNPDLIDERPTPDEWRDEHGYDDEDRSDVPVDSDKDDEHRDESTFKKIERKIKGD